MLYERTNEQLLIREEILNPTNPILLIKATAGSSKSFTLVDSIKHFAKHNPTSSTLCLVFGSTPAAELAEGLSSVSDNAQAMTIHSLAYRNTISKYGWQTPVLSYWTWRHIPKSIFRPFGTDNEILQLISNFCKSPELSFDDYLYSIQYNDKKLADIALKLLNLMLAGDMPITHDFYLKMFHIAVMTGKLTLPHYDRLAVDEFNDISQITLDIVKSISATQKIFVGDSCLVGNTKVLTSTGWRKIKSIVRSLEKNEEIFVKSYNIENDSFTFEKASNPQRLGLKQTLKIKTNKSTLKCTGNHKILTISGWKRADELKIGDGLIKYCGDIDVGIPKQLNNDQMQILYGSFLGDGYINKMKIHDNIQRVTFGHSIAQRNYFNWKCDAFNISKSMKQFKQGGKRIIKGKECIVNDFVSATSRVFYMNKNIQIDDIENIDELGLAIWLMDDGSIKSRNKKKNGVEGVRGITLSTAAFNEEENKKLIDILFNNFGLIAKLGKDRDYFELNFGKEHSKKILNIVKNYIHDDFIGKFKDNKSTYNLNNKQSNHSIDVVLNISDNGEHEVFDIEVENNHNFIVSDTAIKKEKASGIVVHNCQSIFHFLNLVDGFKYFHNAKQLHLSKSFRVDSKFAPYIQSFLRTHLDEQAVFDGMEYEPNQPITTKFYLTRTNASIIAKMIQLNRAGTPYGLAHKAKLKQMFKLPLFLVYAKPGAKQLDEELKHYQHDIDEYGALKRTSRTELSKFQYLLQSNPYDSALKSAIRLITQFGPNEIINTYDQAELHIGSKQNLTLMTAFMSKGGTADQVELDDDLNDMMDDILDIPSDERTDEDRSNLCLYFVSVSRHRHKLINGKHLIGYNN